MARLSRRKTDVATTEMFERAEARVRAIFEDVPGLEYTLDEIMNLCFASFDRAHLQFLINATEREVRKYVHGKLHKRTA